MSHTNNKESWNSRTGVILAVTGSAVGLANFLKFPGQAAQFGGGAFMIAYFVSLVIIALPIAWAEWTMGRYGGKFGFSSCPGIFNAVCKHSSAKYFGSLGVLVPLIIYTYLSYIESWCLGYAVNFLTDSLEFNNIDDATNFWFTFIGANEDGSAIGFGLQKVGCYLLIAFMLNFYLIYRGVSKGIEAFCRYAVPTLIIIAMIILVRVLTLAPPESSAPEQNINNGLGYMWNPTKVYFQEYNPLKSKWIDSTEILGQANTEKYTQLAEANPDRFKIKKVTALQQLKRPKLWLAAASQIFFSLSVGFGLIITYASYMKKDDDVVLSSLSAASANEFCEVGLGGLITIPAAYAFLGTAGVAGQTVFGLGFKTLPMVFNSMPLGNLFGFLFFFLLFLAAVNGAISCLQPSIAFLEETLMTDRKHSVAILGGFTALGSLFVVWFSKDAKALDTLDFWAGNFLVFISATIQIILFGWVLGVDKGLEEANHGAAVKISGHFKFVIKYLCPLFLLAIFFMWLGIDVLGVGGTGIDSHITDLLGTKDKPVNPVAWMSISIIVATLFFMALIISRTRRYKQFHN